MNKNILKKLFVVTFAFLFIVTLSACDINDIIGGIQNGTGNGENTELTDEEKVIDGLSKVGITFAENDSDKSVTSDVVFKTLEENGFTVTWSSANTDILGNDGKVTRPDADTQVKVTVTIEFNGAKLSKTFTLTVKAKDAGNTENPGTDDNTKTISEILAMEITDGNVTEEKYTVTGKITSVANETYGNINITDDTGATLLVYGLYDAAGTRYDAMTEKPVAGDTITVNGAVKNYKGTIEIMNGTLVKLVKGTGEENPGTDNPGETTDPTVETVDATVTEILGLSVETGSTTEAFYKVTGKITAFDNVDYGRFYITDGTKTLYIYGLYDATGAKYGEMTSKPDAGDSITLYGQVTNYQGTIEIKNAVLVSFEDGVADAVVEGKVSEMQTKEVGSYVKTSGTVVAVYARGYMIADETGAIVVYMNMTTFDVKVGEVVVVEGALAEYHGTKQFTNSAKITKNGTKEVDTGEPLVITAENIEATITDAKVGTYFKATGKVVLDGTYYNVELGEAEKKISITYPTDSLGLNLMVGKQATITGYVLYSNTDGTMLQVMVISAECLEEATGVELPINSDFTATKTGDTTLPSGWTWGKANSKGAYASLYQSFRLNGESIVSEMFKASGKFTVSLNYYMNNVTTTGSSKVTITLYSADGEEVSKYTSDELNAGATGVANCHTVEAEFEATGICYVKIEYVKVSGGNLAFNKVVIAAKAAETN